MQASTLSGRRILLGVTGGIAAYKTPDLVRAFQKAGAEVRCVLTESAARLVAPAALSALTRSPVTTEIFGDDHSVYTRHIDTAQWAEVLLIAPATANSIARFAAGQSDDPVAMAWLTVQGPHVLCPSMNTRMLEAPATQRNLRVLAGDGAHILDPDDGMLACGETGPGRLPEASAIVDAVRRILNPVTRAKQPLRILLTMGRTEEPIDDVRILTNHSSGRTGAELAQAALERGHSVTVVRGPCDYQAPAGCHVIPVRTALQMHDATLAAWEQHDVAICAAAVADFRPASRAEGKIPASRGLPSIELVPNPDILATLCSQSRPDQKVVGFALESGDLQRGSDKLAAKGAHIAVCNDPLHDQNLGGFGKNTVWAWVGRAGDIPEAHWMEKPLLSQKILAAVEEL